MADRAGRRRADADRVEIRIVEPPVALRRVVALAPVMAVVVVAVAVEVGRAAAPRVIVSPLVMARRRRIVAAVVTIGVSRGAVMVARHQSGRRRTLVVCRGSGRST